MLLGVDRCGVGKFSGGVVVAPETAFKKVLWALGCAVGGPAVGGLATAWAAQHDRQSQLERDVRDAQFISNVALRGGSNFQWEDMRNVVRVDYDWFVGQLIPRGRGRQWGQQETYKPEVNWWNRALTMAWLGGMSGIAFALWTLIR